jgi:hypothetical protein
MGVLPPVESQPSITAWYWEGWISGKDRKYIATAVKVTLASAESSMDAVVEKSLRKSATYQYRQITGKPRRAVQPAKQVAVAALKQRFPSTPTKERRRHTTISFV